MEDQYGMADLRQYISSRPLFPPIPQPPDLLSSHRGLNPPHPYDMLVFRSDSTTSAPSVTTANPNAAGAAAASSSATAVGGCFIGFESGINSGAGGGAGRWPRQETLTLLEIRSRLDSKFKEANQKGPLWDEVSRIMSEEHGYQRSGKKCREKFENLYKYYKKTKEGKAGRQDGKHYRFFRQLEALYGEANYSASASASASEARVVGGSFHCDFPNNNSTSLTFNREGFQGSKLSDTSLSLSNCSDADSSSSDDSDLKEGIDDDNDPNNKKRRGKRGWKVKIRDFIDAQMKKLMDKQEAWMERMVRTMEHKEHERMLREDEWRKQEAARMDREHKFWANERAWIEARDAALMEALHKLTGKELRASSRQELMAAETSNQNDDGSETMTNSAKGDVWPESEVARLIQLRTCMDEKFRQRGVSEEVLWEEIASKMACVGHDRSGLMCKDKWDGVNNYVLKCNKKRKEEPKGCTYYQNHEPISNQKGGGVYSCDTSEQGVDHATRQLNDHASSSPNTNSTGNAMSDNCFRYFMGDAYGRILD